MERATQERLVGATLLIVAGVIMIPWLLDGNSADPAVTDRELVLPGGNTNGNETRVISLEVPRPESSSSENNVKQLDVRTVRDVDQPVAAMTLPAPKTVSSEPGTESGTVPSRFAKPMPESTAPSKPTSTQATAKPAPALIKEEVASLPKPKPASSTVNQPPSESRPAAVTPKPVTRAATPPRSEPKPVSTASADKPWAVQVGSFASQENAERLAGLLRGKGYKAFVMRNVIEGRVRFRVRVGPVAQRNEAELLAAALREDRQPARVLSHP